MTSVRRGAAITSTRWPLCREDSEAGVAIVADLGSTGDGQRDRLVGLLLGLLGHGQLLPGNGIDLATVNGDGDEALLGGDHEIGVDGTLSQLA